MKSEIDLPCPACTATHIAPRDAGTAFVLGVVFAMAYNNETIRKKMCEKHMDMILFAALPTPGADPIPENERR